MLVADWEERRRKEVEVRRWRERRDPNPYETSTLLTDFTGGGPGLQHSVSAQGIEDNSRVALCPYCGYGGGRHAKVCGPWFGD